MNPFSFLIPVTILGSLALEFIVESLNLSRLTTKIPKEFQDVYNQQKYQKSQEYLRTTTKFSLIQSTVSTLLLLSFIYLTGFNFLDTFARSFGLSPVSTGIIFTSLLLILNTLASLPFSLYSTFVIETKFGFNKTTPHTFFLDLAKSLLITLLLVNLILSIISHIFHVYTTQAWLLAWVVITLIQLFLTFISPIILLPIFNKFTPLPQGELRRDIESFAKSQHFVLQDIFTMDGSRRSSKANAFFTGFGPYKRIALFDTLIKNHTTSELVTVLAHEIGHFKLHHIHQMLALSTLILGVSLFIISQLINNHLLFNVFGMDHVSLYASLIFAGLLLQPLFTLISPVTNWLSRRNEFAADRFAVTTTGKPKTFIRALKKLSLDNLSNLTPHPVKVFFDYSHPPVLVRIQTIKKISVKN